MHAIHHCGQDGLVVAAEEAVPENQLPRSLIVVFIVLWWYQLIRKYLNEGPQNEEVKEIWQWAEQTAWNNVG